MNALDRRVARLEAEATTTPPYALIWRRSGETTDAAVRRYLTDRHDDTPQRLVVLGWRAAARRTVVALDR